MIKSKFTFFQMKIKAVFLQTPKFNQACFDICPETFYPINMGMFIGKFIVAMLYTVMLLVAKIHKAIISVPAIRMDGAFKFNTSPNNPLQRAFGAIRDYFSVNIAITFEDTKNNSFSPCSTAP